MRMISKVNILKAVYEDRLAKAKRSRPVQQDIADLRPKEDKIELYRTPERKGESGWRGPCDLLDISTEEDDQHAAVKRQGLPYIVPLRRIRGHLAYRLRMFLCGRYGGSYYTFYAAHVDEDERMPEILYTDFQQLVNQFFDSIDGCLPHKVFLGGKYTSEEGVTIYIPEGSEKEPTPLLRMATTTATDVMKIGPIDGVRYGTEIKQFNSFSSATYAVLLFWNRGDRENHVIWEVMPWKTVKIGKYVRAAWEDTSAVMFYNLTQSIEVIHPPRKLPDLSDLDMSPIQRMDGDGDDDDDDGIPWSLPHDEDMLDPPSSGMMDDNDPDSPDRRKLLHRSRTPPPRRKPNKNDSVNRNKDDSMKSVEEDARDPSRNDKDDRSRSRTKNMKPTKNSEESTGSALDWTPSGTGSDTPGAITIDDQSMNEKHDMSRSRSRDKGSSKKTTTTENKKPGPKVNKPSTNPKSSADGKATASPELDQSPRHPDARSSHGPLPPVSDSPIPAPETSMQPSTGTDESTVCYPPDESTAGFKDPNETLGYYGNASVVNHYLEGRRGMQLFTTDTEFYYDGYYDACEEMEPEYLAAQREAMVGEYNYVGLAWDRSSADLVSEVPVSQPRCFYMDLVTGECEIVDTFHTMQDLSDQEITDNWTQVEAADMKEVQQFVDLSAFERIHYTQVRVRPTDCVWVRKWKQKPGGAITIKSRLCCRGFLDHQRHLLPTKSSTASRLTHRIFVSLSALLDFEIESWDVGGAFLKGLAFTQLNAMFEKMGIDCPKRQVVIKPPGNVWRLLPKCKNSRIHVSDDQTMLDFLMPLRCMYGLNGAPLSFQLTQATFYVEIIGAVASKFDECVLYWLSIPGAPTALASTHVDDNEVSSARNDTWRDETHRKF